MGRGSVARARVGVATAAGLLSGLIQEGYAVGNLLAALAFLPIYPYFNALYPATAGA